MHEKMLNAIYLYLFHNDTLAENNSLNGHSNEPWISGDRGSSYLLSSKIFLDWGNFDFKIIVDLYDSSDDLIYVAQSNYCFIQTKLLTALFKKTIERRNCTKFIKILEIYFLEFSTL